MVHQKEDFIKSKVAVKVLKEIAEREEGSYSTEIAEELGKTRSSISRILSELESKGILKKSKRTRAQYFEIDYEGLSNYWFDLLKEHLESKIEDEGTKRFLKTDLRNFEESEDKIKDFVEGYFRDIFEHRDPKMNLEDLLFNSMMLSLFGSILENLENPKLVEEIPIRDIYPLLMQYSELENYKEIVVGSYVKGEL